MAESAGGRGGTSSWLRKSTGLSSIILVGEQLYNMDAQLASAMNIKEGLLIAWLAFDGCCLITSGLYVCVSNYRHQDTAVSLRLQPVDTCICGVWGTFIRLWRACFLLL